VLETAAASKPAPAAEYLTTAEIEAAQKPRRRKRKEKQLRRRPAGDEAGEEDDLVAALEAEAELRAAGVPGAAGFVLCPQKCLPACKMLMQGNIACNALALEMAGELRAPVVQSTGLWVPSALSYNTALPCLLCKALPGCTGKSVQELFSIYKE
jgi:hypothetical protein